MRQIPPEELERILDYVGEDLPPDEMAQGARWIAEDKDRHALAEYFAESRERLDHARETHRAGAEAEMVRRVATAIHQTPVRRKAVSRNRDHSLRWAGLGAIAVVAIAFGVGRWSGHRGAHIERRYETQAGQRSTIRLADGSTLTLAPMTAVTMTDGGAKVAGEVYFAIAAHPSRPFVIQTRNASVQVLGTRFSVRQYASEVRSRVVVEDGRVAVQSLGQGSGRGERAVMSAQMLAMVSDSGVSVRSGIATREYTGWTQGTLVFKHVPLRDVLAELGRAYGVDVSAADSGLAGQKIIAEVEVNKKSFAEVLDAISLSIDAHYVQHGSAFVVSPGRRNDVKKVQVQRERFPQPEKQYGR